MVCNFSELRSVEFCCKEHSVFVHNFDFTTKHVHVLECAGSVTLSVRVDVF